MFFNEEGILNIDEMVAGNASFKTIMEDGVITEAEIQDFFVFLKECLGFFVDPRIFGSHDIGEPILGRLLFDSVSVQVFLIDSVGTEDFCDGEFLAAELDRFADLRRFCINIGISR